MHAAMLGSKAWARSTQKGKAWGIGQAGCSDLCGVHPRCRAASQVARVFWSAVRPASEERGQGSGARSAGSGISAACRGWQASGGKEQQRGRMA